MSIVVHWTKPERFTVKNEEFERYPITYEDKQLVLKVIDMKGDYMKKNNNLWNISFDLTHNNSIRMKDFIYKVQKYIIEKNIIEKPFVNHIYAGSSNEEKLHINDTPLYIATRDKIYPMAKSVIMNLITYFTINVQVEIIVGDMINIKYTPIINDYKIQLVYLKYYSKEKILLKYNFDENPEITDEKVILQSHSNSLLNEDEGLFFVNRIRTCWRVCEKYQ